MQGDDEVTELAVIERGSADVPSVLLGETTTRTSLVRSTLRDMIIAGKFKPGDTLVERHLAAMLGVSKTPVREALISLASTGLVRVSHNRGVVVRRPSFDDMWKVFETRLLLEPWATGRATARGSAQTYADAAAALEASKALLDADDQIKLSLANRRFHRALYSQAGNELVIAQLDEMQDLISLGFVVVWERTVWPVWREEYDEHCEILAAVQAGDADTATSRARKHIESSLALFEKHWDADT
ncbi:MAG: FCD domain-containing protein [Streptosporangiales bacterium]|nr:FCD domain-containing protein [Streptosporangiales bacterium]